MKKLDAQVKAGVAPAFELIQERRIAGCSGVVDIDVLARPFANEVHQPG